MPTDYCIMTSRKPSESCQFCRAGVRRIDNTQYDHVTNTKRRWFTHLRMDGHGFVDCEDQTYG